jgi:hypothetical protein
MSSNGSTPEAPKPESASHQGLKSLIAKGAVGALTLAGTTAIPLMVQKYFSGTPAPAPAVQASPVQVFPAASPVVSPVESSVVSPLPSPLPSPTVLPAQMPAGPSQAGVVQIRLGTDEAGLMQVEMDEASNKKPGTRKKQKREDDDD